MALPTYRQEILSVSDYGNKEILYLVKRSPIVGTFCLTVTLNKSLIIKNFGLDEMEAAVLFFTKYYNQHNKLGKKLN